jgi:hypothetical protein
VGGSGNRGGTKVELSSAPRPPGGGGGAELGGDQLDIALPDLAGEHRAATLTPVRRARGASG